MKILSDIVFLASDTTRTKAYLQVMVQNQILPSLCIVYADDYSKMETDVLAWRETKIVNKYFDSTIPLLSLVKKYFNNYLVVNNKDINSNDVQKVFLTFPQKYIIYSGYGGGILKPHMFKLGKKFIHVHAGILPDYRGSTTAYYSIIDKGVVGATAFFLNEEIDEGDIICQSEYPMPQETINLDYIYEPYIRACELVKALKRYNEITGFAVIPQKKRNANTYFIIHPVLKHLAIKKVENNIKKSEK